MKTDTASFFKRIPPKNLAGLIALILAALVSIFHPDASFSERPLWLFMILFAAGVVCLLPKERIGLWAGWALVFLAHIWLFEHARVVPGTFLKLVLAGYRNPGVTGVFAGFSAVGCFCLFLGTFSSYFFNLVPGKLTRTHKVLILLGWIVFALTFLMKLPEDFPYILHTLLIVWGQYTLIHALAVSSILWLLQIFRKE